MRTKWFDYTVYSKGSEEPTIGITFKPMPNITKREFNELYFDLEKVELEFEAAGGHD
jgi:hypothetical protein